MLSKNLLIIFGGKSSEHDISIISAFQFINSCDEYLYNMVPVYIDKNGIWHYVKNISMNDFLKNKDSLPICQLGVNENYLYIKKGNIYKRKFNIDVAIPILHGVNGEDGAIAGLLKLSNIPFVGSDSISSAIGMDKLLFKKVCKDFNILPVECIENCNIENEDLIDKISENIGFPCIIKPCRQGSSIGINICENKENLLENIKKSLKFDKKVLIERFVGSMREFNVAILSSGGELVFSEIEEPILTKNILTFEDKYMNFSGQEVSKKIPAKIGVKLREKIIKTAKDCYLKCGFSGVVRIDFIYDVENKILYLNEVNTIPGAMALYLFEYVEIGKRGVIDSLVREALRVHQNGKNDTCEFNTNVLNNKIINKFSH